MLSSIMTAGVWAIASSALAQTVQVNVCVSNAQGQPVENAPLVVDSLEPLVLRTDETGCTSLSLDGSPVDRTIAVSPTWGVRATDDTVEAIRADRQTARAILDQYAFRYVYRVDIPSGATLVDVSIDALPSIIVTGTVLPNAAEPSVYKAAVLGYRAETRCGDAGELRLTGVPKGQAVDIIIYNIFGGPVDVVHLSAAQTTADVDIGTLIPTVVEEGAPLQIGVTQNEEVLEAFEKRGTSVTLITQDGSRMLTYWLNAAHQPAIGDPPVTPSVPAGEYFVVPGWATQNSFVTDMWSYVRDGTIDLVGAGVPVLTVVDGQPVTGTIDAAAAAAAIRGAGGG